jgi:hypothetical protein
MRARCSALLTMIGGACASQGGNEHSCVMVPLPAASQTMQAAWSHEVTQIGQGACPQMVQCVSEQASHSITAAPEPVLHAPSALGARRDVFPVPCERWRDLLGCVDDPVYRNQQAQHGPDISVAFHLAG